MYLHYGLNNVNTKTTKYMNLLVLGSCNQNDKKRKHNNFTNKPHQSD